MPNWMRKETEIDLELIPTATDVIDPNPRTGKHLEDRFGTFDTSEAFHN